MSERERYEEIVRRDLEQLLTALGVSQIAFAPGFDFDGLVTLVVDALEAGTAKLVDGHLSFIKLGESSSGVDPLRPQKN